MNKTLVKITVLLLLFISNAIAQSKSSTLNTNPSQEISPENKLFVGKWELVGVPADIGFSYQKVFTAAGDFANYRIYPNDIIKTHYGKYLIKDKATLLEIVSTETDASRSHVSGQTTTILYKFSDDKKLLIIKGLAINGNSDFEETWKRIELPVVTLQLLKTTNSYQ